MPPPELHDHPLRKRGRPLLSDAALALPEHALARYQRKYRAAIARAKAQVELTEAVCILAQITAVPAAEAEAERRAAEAQRKLRKLERQLDAANASDGLVADGPRAIRLRAFARDDDGCLSHVCCSVCLSGDSDGVFVQRMRCCGESMCAQCLQEWLRRNGQPVEVGYESGVQGVEHVRRGRKVTVPMNTHACPVCRRAVESVRRGLV